MTIAADSEVAIPFSRAKLALILVWPFAMVAGSLWVFCLPSEWIVAAYKNYAAVGIFRATGAIGTIIFGLVASGVSVLIVRRPIALVIDRQGIIDRSDWYSVGRIDWTEVRAIRTIWFGMRVLMIDVYHPRQVVDRGKIWQRLPLRVRTQLVGTPIWLSSFVLAIGFAELRSTIGRFLDEAKARRDF